ncbi:MAG: hypothetical protein ACLRHJ_13250 [Faecalimonas umbilicata]|uniref:hypothetical protein n=1 Tax=Faecalimonas umbilicata TaxID=1912855 RepID=UPI0039A06384
MFNIKFRGIFEDEKQLEPASKSITGIKFEEPEDINTLMKKGFLNIIACNCFFHDYYRIDNF